MRDKIKLVSTAGTGYFYTTDKNKKLSTEKLLLAAVQRISDRAFALRHVELQSVLEPAPEGESALSEIRADVWPLLERLDGNRTLKEAIALTRLDEFEAGKLACEAIAGSAERFDLYGRIKHVDFPGGALLRRPALVLAMLWFRMLDLL